MLVRHKRDKEAIITLAKEGKTIPEIATLLTIPYQSVYTILRRAGIKAFSKHGLAVKVDKDLAIKLYTEGTSVINIANSMGVTREAIYLHLRKEGILPKENRYG